jgi:hypothetical protein
MENWHSQDEFEGKYSDRPDELKFILMIYVELLGLEPITARSWVLIGKKGAYKEKGTLSGASR